MKQIFGKKVGMTRVFTAGGENVPVTVLEIVPNVITQVKTKEKDGYNALQIGFGEQKPQRIKRAMTGHFAGAKKGVFRYTRELRLGDEQIELKPGDAIALEGLFEVGSRVDVAGVTVGKGFAGVMKRHHMKGQPMTRGTHEYRRHGGSIGNRKFPGRTFPLKRMPGHMGVDKQTALGLEVIDTRDGLLIVRGSVPGPKNGVVFIRSAVKG